MLVTYHGLRHHHRERLVRVPSLADSRSRFLGLGHDLLDGSWWRVVCSVKASSSFFRVFSSRPSPGNLRVDLEPLLGRRS